MNEKNKKIVVIGGGAGGLELVARLCNEFKNDKHIDITLIDKQLKHVWKPLLHQVAAGTYSSDYDEIDYITYAYQKGFKFICGLVKSVDRENKSIILASNHEDSFEMCEHIIFYDILVIATGSHANDFNIPGVNQHCLFLDDLSEAELFHKILVRKIISVTQAKDEEQRFNISIIGGGATGVELAAELNHVLLAANKYTYRRQQNNTFQITLLEAEDRILNMMPERISNVVTRFLLKNKIQIFTQTKVTEVHANGIKTADGKFIESTLKIWVAGVSSNYFSINGLEMNRINQFVVKKTLQTTHDENIFALGDCASCPQVDRAGHVFYVPPRAQAAYQEARMLVKSIKKHLTGKPLPIFKYRDYGSLITLSRFNVVGNLMSTVAKNFYIEGILARLTYWFLHKRHLMILKGVKYVMLSMLAGFLMKRQQPEIKLH